MACLRAAMASVRLSVTPPRPPLKRPLRAPNRSAGGELATAAAAGGGTWADAGVGVALATSGVSRAAGVSPVLSTPLSELSHGLTGAGGTSACVAFTVGGAATSLAISGP